MGYVQDTCEKQGFEVDPISVVEHFTLGRHFGIQQKNVDISGLVGRSVSEPVQYSHRSPPGRAVLNSPESILGQWKNGRF